MFVRQDCDAYSKETDLTHAHVMLRVSRLLEKEKRGLVQVKFLAMSYILTDHDLLESDHQKIDRTRFLQWFFHLN